VLAFAAVAVALVWAAAQLQLSAAVLVFAAFLQEQGSDAPTARQCRRRQWASLSGARRARPLRTHQMLPLPLPVLLVLVLVPQ
jgi:hypothetical protein